MPIIINDKEVIREYRDTLDNYYLELLLDKYEGYVRKVTYNIYAKYFERYSYNDILQEVRLEFIKIVKFKFNIDSPFTFFTYMYKVLKLASLNFIRDDRYYPMNREDRVRKLKGNFVHLSDINLRFEQNEQREIHVLDFLQKKRDLECESVEDIIETKMFIEEVKKALSDDEFNLLCDYFIKEKSQSIIAKELGTNQTTISKTIIKKLEKIEENVRLY